MSDTPRTDAEAERCGVWDMVPASFARQLERELAQKEDFLAQTERVARMYALRLGPCRHSEVKCVVCAAV